MRIKKTFYEWCIENNRKDLLDSWSNKNNDTPKDVSYGSKKKRYWHCPICNGTYEMSIQSKTSNKPQGCPYCNNRKILSGFNDLKTKNPILASEWNYSKNLTTPDKIFPNYTKKVWWLCPICKHEWQATPNSRHTNKNGCPRCSEERRKSFPEKAIYYYLKQVFPNAIENYKFSNKTQMEFDIYIKDLLLAIEYDGSFYHTNIEKDKKKYIFCINNNIELIRIREKNCPKNNEIATISYYLQKDLNKDLDKAIIFIYKYIKQKIKQNIIIPDINIERDTPKIYDLIELSFKKHSLYNMYPELANEWHPTLNSKRTPERVYPNSNTKVYWKCPKCGYGTNGEWYVSPNTRIEANGKINGCPCCSNKLLRIGFNDLESFCNRQENEKYRHILNEWDYKKNKKLPKNYTYTYSKEKIWWLCQKCGYSWQTSINNRIIHNSQCPVCANKIVLENINSLQKTHPQIAKEWDYTKNPIDINPKNITYGKNTSYYWICPQGHSYKATPLDRVKKKTGCPICSNKKVLYGFNDLETYAIKNNMQYLLEEWDYDNPQNDNLRPCDCVYSSNKKIFWKCKKCNFSWQSSIRYRVKNNGGCPSCARTNNKEKIRKKRFNPEKTLAKINPILAIEFDINNNKEHNIIETPDTLTIGSHMKVWWKCPICGTQWEMKVKDRDNGCGCPTCKHNVKRKKK